MHVSDLFHSEKVFDTKYHVRWMLCEPPSTVSSKHSNAFQDSELFEVNMRLAMLHLKEGWHPPGSCFHQDIIFLHAAVLELASKH